MAQNPSRWEGWPNGSAVFRMETKAHIGRHIRDPNSRGSRGWHILKWNPITKGYIYVKLAPLGSDISGLL